MDPALVFFAIRGLLRVGTAARTAYEQNVRDQDFRMPDLPVLTLTKAGLLDRHFNQTDGIHRELARDNRPLAKYWIQGPTGGLPNPSLPESEALLLAAIAELERRDALEVPQNAEQSWAALRAANEAAVTGLLDPWSKEKAPPNAWTRIALALAEVALDYVGTNPGVLGIGGNGEKLIQVVCDNLQLCLVDIDDVPQAYFVERMGVAILQAGLKTVTDNADLIVVDKRAATVITGVAKPLSDLFASSTKAGDFAAALQWSNIRDTVLPRMISIGLEALAEHQQELLGASFDPNRTLGYFTQGFLAALSQQPVANLGTAQGWLPIYQALLKAAASKPNLLVPGTTADAQMIQNLIAGLAGKLQPVPPIPFTTASALGLAEVVVDVLQKSVPARTSDPWLLLVPTALQAVVEGLQKPGASLAAVAQDQLIAIVRVVLQQASVTPGMIVGNGSSAEVQAIIAAIAGAMARDTKLLISEQGWMQIAATATAVAAKNPGKLFSISDATPEGQLAGKLIGKLLASASASFGAARSANAVLFGDTLVGAVADTLTAAAGNARGALENIDQTTVLIDQLNKLVADPKRPIGAADWSWLYRNLIADVFDKGTLKYTDDQLRGMLYDHQLPKVSTP
jgi:hypothetical protein